MALLVDGKYDESLTYMLRMLEERPERPSFVYDIVSEVAMLAGDYDTSRKYALLFNPVLASDAELVINKHTVRSVVQLAFLDQHQGRPQIALEMLNRALPYAQSRPRLGMSGHGILDVQILTLLGRKDDALAALQAAVAEGFRSTIIYNLWLLTSDPYLAELRDDSRFRESIAIIDTDMQRMHRNTMQAEAAGDWQPLLQIAIEEASDLLQAALTIR